ncbi:MAG: transcriptional regulator [Thaumarchaeota archaeon]|nr:transcriptional regulator [Nitrososphaerota archaeon]
MANDRALGSAILAGSVVGIIVYGYLLYRWPLIILEITAFVAIVVLLGILAWIGYTMATTPPPEPISDMAPPAAPAAAGTTDEKKPT